MNVDAEIVALIITIIGASIAMGAERQARRDLERRHEELSKDLRPRLDKLEAAVTTSQAWQSGVDEKLTHLVASIIELKLLVQALANTNTTTRRK